MIFQSPLYEYFSALHHVVIQPKIPMLASKPAKQPWRKNQNWMKRVSSPNTAQSWPAKPKASGIKEISVITSKKPFLVWNNAKSFYHWQSLESNSMYNEILPVYPFAFINQAAAFRASKKCENY